MSLQSIFRIFVISAVVSLVSVQSVEAARSRAEGKDNSAAARASSWTGTIIGVNMGDQSVVVTDGVKLDHIKKFAQRSVKISDSTEIIKDGEVVTFDALDVGQRITAYGSYNPKSRIVTAVRVEVGAKVAKVAVVAAPEPSEPAPAAKPKAKFTRNLAQGSTGAEVAALQQILIAKGYLSLPKGTKLGNYGPSTAAAVQKYQKALKLQVTGTIGSKTRTSLNK